MPYSPVTNGNNTPMGFSKGQTDYALTEAGSAVNDGAGHIYAAPAPAIPDTPIAVSGTAVAAAANAQTLPGVAGKTTFIQGLCISTTNPAAAVSGVATITGLLAGTISVDVVESATAGALVILNFPTALPASAVNTGIVVTLPAITSGAVSAVSAWGFQR